MRVLVGPDGHIQAKIPNRNTYTALEIPTKRHKSVVHYSGKLFIKFTQTFEEMKKCYCLLVNIALGHFSVIQQAIPFWRLYLTSKSVLSTLEKKVYQRDLENCTTFANRKKPHACMYFNKDQSNDKNYLVLIKMLGLIGHCCVV